MLVIVTYDVSTQTLEGRRRLRHVAKTCVKWGQRVQMSVFECRVNAMQFEELERKLIDIMNMEEDSIRFYRLTEPTDIYVKEYGNVKATNFDSDSLII
jgi:CRISPR-associated protein Cas2